MVADRTPTRQINGVRLLGVFPHVQPEFGPAYTTLNEHISTAATAHIENALRLRARTITFSYQVFPTRDVVSIVLYAQIAAVTTREAVITINFDPRTGELVTLRQAMGFDVIPLIDRILSDMTRENPQQYYAAANASVSAFYLTETQLVILFDELQITTVPAGAVTRLPLTLDYILRPAPIAPGEYRIETAIYNLKMVPIGTIARALGHDTAYDKESGVATVWWNTNRDQVMMELTVGVNSYAWDGSLQRALEAPPEMYNSRVLIPITFFDQIMPRTTYHIDTNGYIHFLAYRPM